MEKREEVYVAALAGLLHDVGKFAQRAGERGTLESAEAKAEFGYYHALLTADIVERLIPGPWRATVKRAAGNHHRPHDNLDAIVQLADHLSAGEREDDEDNLIPYLRSIFCRLAGHNAEGYFPLQELDPTTEMIFPYEHKPGGWRQESHLGEYQRLWQKFESAAKQLSGGDLPAYVEALLDLLQRYTWCIPSAYYHNAPDVSLYDHSRTTAALAACFACDRRDLTWCESQIKAFYDADKQAEPVALLVTGDISGVQKFLYSLASDNAMKSLRGRSVYLQLLTEAVVQYLLTELGLPLTNLLYAGGGNFYVIVPVSDAEQLLELQAEVTQRLLVAHEGNLRLALAWTPVRAYEFKIDRFHKAWERLHDRLRRVKERPLAELEAETIVQEIGQAWGEGGNVPVCPVCGREEPRLKEDEVCSLCSSLEDLGRQVARATHLVMALREPTILKEESRVTKWWHGLELFGVNVWMVNVDEEPNNGRFLPGGLEKTGLMRIYQLQTGRSEDVLLNEVRQHGPVVWAFRPFAQMTPMRQDKYGERPVMLEELTLESRGIPRWGVLRMDVDNLGDLFRKGFRRDGEDHLTLSRVAALSFSLRLFFEGYAPTLGSDDRDRLYLQYAGGDDLFVVGSWDALPGFAHRVRQEFTRYAVENPSVTLSGGISIHPEKFPLYRAAEEAGEAEYQAKGKRYWEDANGAVRMEAKNALCFLDVPLAWDEFEQVMEQAKKFCGWVESDQVSKSLLQNLLTLYDEWVTGRDRAVKNAWLKRGKFYYGPWVWHAVYQLNRTACEDKTARDEIRNWPARMLSDQALIVRLGVAARWAAFLTRKQSK